MLTVVTLSRECLGLIWLTTDSFIILAVHGILSNLHVHRSKASILLLSAFLNVQLLHLPSTAGKTTAYTNLTSVLVENPKPFIIFISFGTAALPNLILLLTSSLA
jgi:hypothetical protein